MNNTESEMADSSQDTQTQEFDGCFEMIKFLGDGCYGDVYLVRKVGGADSGRLYALKQMKKDKIVAEQRVKERARFERAILAGVHGLPFLVNMQYAFETDDSLNIVMDYAGGGDLYKLWQDNICFEEDHVRIYIAEMVLALEQLHKRCIVHSDIKLENILLDSTGHVVLTDFGFSRYVFPSRQSEQIIDLGGTYEYMAPEVVRSSAGQGFVSDWWSMGVVTYELLSGKSPFLPKGQEHTRCKENIYKCILNSDPCVKQDFSATAKSFIQSLLVKDPYTRMGARGADEIKRHPFFAGVDWDSVMRKTAAAPFVPPMENELDVSNFAEEFTKRAITQPPVLRPVLNGPKVFKDYAYVAPTLTARQETASNVALTIVPPCTSATTQQLQPAAMTSLPQVTQPRRRLLWRAAASERRRRLELKKRIQKAFGIQKSYAESAGFGWPQPATTQKHQSRPFYCLPLPGQAATVSAAAALLALSISTPNSTTVSNVSGGTAVAHLPGDTQAAEGIILKDIDVVGVCDPLETRFSPAAQDTVTVEPILLDDDGEEVEMEEAGEEAEYILERNKAGVCI